MLPVIEVDHLNLSLASSVLEREQLKGFDTETTGAYFTDRPFVLTIATQGQAYFFDLRKVVPEPRVLSGQLFSHNAKFDLMMLEKVGLRIGSPVHCTMVAERLLRNDHMDYSLAATAQRYGYEKDTKLDEYVNALGLKTKRVFLGNTMDTVPRYYDVPHDILVNYAAKDAWLHLMIGLKQREKLAAII